MLEELTPDTVFSEVMMEEPPPRLVLLVEGPDEDTILFEHLADGVSRIIAGNKKAVLGAAKIAEDGGMSNVFGLVDRDLDTLRGDDSYPRNVVATDAYDLIADLIAALGDEALRRAINAHAAESVRAVEAASARDIVDIVFDLTSPLAAVRLASLKSGYPLILKRYEFRQVLTDSFEAADVSIYVLNSGCKKPSFRIDQSVIDDVRSHLGEVSDRKHSGGHDLVSASVTIVAKGGGQVSKKAIASNIMSFATCDVLASIACLQTLNARAVATIGQNLFDCIAA